MRIFAEHGGADGNSNGDTDGEPEASAAEEDGDACPDSDSEDYAQADLHGWSLHVTSSISLLQRTGIVCPRNFLVIKRHPERKADTRSCCHPNARVMCRCAQCGSQA